MGWFGPSGECGCCGTCWIIFFFYDCRLYWYVNPSLLPAEPYTVTITTPSGTDTYDSISGGTYETPEEGTYSGTVTKDAVESASCSIIVEPCTPTYPCCVRTSGMNVRITGGGDFVQWKGGRVESSIFYGAYAEATLPTWDNESLRVGAMSSGSKTDINCYDLWGVADFPDVENVVIGSGHVTFYSGIPGYANAAAVPCSIPTGFFHYLRLYFDYYLQYYNNGVLFRAELTAEDHAYDGGGTAPTTPTVGTHYTFLDAGWGLCAVDLNILTPDIKGAHNPNLSLSVCNAGDETVVMEYWPDVIPL